jgi:hypothetical protein
MKNLIKLAAMVLVATQIFMVLTQQHGVANNTPALIASDPTDPMPRLIKRKG